MHIWSCCPFSSEPWLQVLGRGPGTISIQHLEFPVFPACIGLRCLTILMGRVRDKDRTALGAPTPARVQAEVQVAAKLPRKVEAWDHSAVGVFIHQTFFLVLLPRCSQGQPVQCRYCHAEEGQQAQWGQQALPG